MQAWTHTTVLLAEAVDALVTRPAGCYVDATFGRGGHSRAILERLGPAGRYNNVKIFHLTLFHLFK